MKQLIEAYNTMIAKVEDFIYAYVLPPMFRIMLIGMQITLVWAFYQTGKHIIGELF
jgi:hypothetical protein